MSANPGVVERPLLPGAEPFSYPGTERTGVLLVHGFTGSPAEMRPVAEALAAHGIGSEGIRLRGHGTHPDDMLGCTYQDWIEDVEAALDRLLTQYQQAIIVGLSMGGTLALNVAARRANDSRVVGVVPICSPLVLDDWRLGLVRFVSRFVKWQGWGVPDIKDRSAWDRHVGYRRFRLGTVTCLLDLMQETRERLAAVRQPILVAQAREDHVVPARNAELIRSSVSSAECRLLLLDNCYHVVTVDYAAAELNAEIVRFVQRLNTRGQAETTDADTASA
ncbi:MAG: alpha/beta hydrolase [Chloroflexota bacterium]